ncbi:MAG: hypothetical protein ACWGQW_23640 [bacterium]
MMIRCRKCDRTFHGNMNLEQAVREYNLHYCLVRKETNDMAKEWSIRFTIVPTSGFNAPCVPLEMMRYDRCTPFEQADVSELACLEVGIADESIAPIQMVHYEHGNKNWKPTEARWRSFGWMVQSIAPAREV